MPRPAVVIDQQISGKPVQPDGERTFAGPEALQGLKNTEKNLLRQVLRLFRSSREAITHGVDAARMQADQLFPSGFVGHSCTAPPAGDQDPNACRPL